MRKLSLVFALGVVLVLGAVGGLSTASQARADGPPNVRTIWIYRSSFTPSMSQEGSGVVVTLVNQDTIPHRIVLYRASTPQSFDVTIQPGEWYTVPRRQPLVRLRRLLLLVLRPRLRLQHGRVNAHEGGPARRVTPRRSTC
jgi:hypothetical protein